MANENADQIPVRGLAWSKGSVLDLADRGIPGLAERIIPMDTFIIKRDGVEIARVTGTNLCFAKIAKKVTPYESEMVDDQFLFKSIDHEDKDKPFFVVALAHHKNLSVEKI